MKKVFVAAAAVLSMAAASPANAALVTFNASSTPYATAFVDGSFSSNLSGTFADGFYGSGTSAFNGYGQDGEFVLFNAPVRLQSLQIGKCAACYDSHPSFFTVNLYGAGSALLDTRSVTASSTAATLIFNRPGVTKVEFTFSGTDGTNPYFGDRRQVAWYTVSDISYLNGVAEPAVWGLMIGGFGLAGLVLRRRRVRAN